MAACKRITEPPGGGGGGGGPVVPGEDTGYLQRRLDQKQQEIDTLREKLKRKDAQLRQRDREVADLRAEVHRLLDTVGPGDVSPGGPDLPGAPDAPRPPHHPGDVPTPADLPPVKWQWEKGFWRDYADADSDMIEIAFGDFSKGGEAVVDLVINAKWNYRFDFSKTSTESLGGRHDVFKIRRVLA